MEEVKTQEIKEVPQGIKWYHPAFLIATWFGIGKIPFAPGTMGSMATFPLFIAFHYLLAVSNSEDSFVNIYLLCVTVIFIIGQWATGVYMKRTGKHDPKEVVIDEVVGQMLVFLGGFLIIAAAFNIFGVLYGTADNPADPVTIEKISTLFTKPPFALPYAVSGSIIYLICFLLFRLFDIWKPWPIGWCDKNIKGSFGVMFDDLFAAMYAVVVLYILAMIPAMIMSK